MGVEIKSSGIVEVDFRVDAKFCELSIDAKVVYPSKAIFKYLAFWRGGDSWAIRFLPNETGEYRVEIDGIETIKFSIDRVKDNSHYLKLSKDKRYLVEGEDKAFFWLSDTWWMALSGRLKFEDFKYLADVRKEMGFNVIQLVAGLFPDMESFDKRGENEGGYVWSSNFESINPNFFEVADKKIEYLYNKGFHIAIVGAWGYYLEKMGIDKMKLHWRYIIARWGVYSSVWIAAGEATMPFYLSKNRIIETQRLKRGWSRVLEYIKNVDSYKRVLTIHPIERSIDEVKNIDLLDINLLQASHHSFESIKKASKLLDSSKDIVTIIDEINYEGILRGNSHEVIRLSFWKSFLKGSKGFGYGANGIWQVNYKNMVFGPSPNGANWGNISWDEAIEFKGAKDIAKSKEFLEGFEWWRLEEVDILEPKIDKDNPKEPIVATIDNIIFIAYFYNPIAPWDKKFKFKLEPNAYYSYYFFSPNSYSRTSIKHFDTNKKGFWQMDTPPSLDDWVLIIEKRDSRNRMDTPFALLKKLLKPRLCNRN